VPRNKFTKRLIFYLINRLPRINENYIRGTKNYFTFPESFPSALEQGVATPCSCFLLDVLSFAASIAPRATNKSTKPAR